ncbi:AraC family ligand binding domain-containing protein [Photobacterium rosenbergii]|uniref:AraC family ligand binding domain-containing protein n=1 Tax=Photobacterium rosenbergii TaxID=294936 RepID=UPI001C99DA59|nr:AraC family ligand binding domain-containing protein [Photobacterium rosenbergii]MBY5948287.1 AraC family ligand binding domain-containing protein [Photobacterium rosenbergii]
MKQAIDYSLHQHSFLDVGSRRKSHTAYMLIMTSGCAFIRLGKAEYTVTAGNGFFIPFDCLHAVTIMPGSTYNKVEFSQRLTTPICREAGFFRMTPLISAVSTELNKWLKLDKEISLEGESGNLLRVLADQVAKLKVNSKSTSPALSGHHQLCLASLLKGDKVTDNKAIEEIANYTGFSVKEIESCVLMREALKLSRSGRKIPQIAESLNTTPELLSSLAIPVLGEAL